MGNWRAISTFVVSLLGVSTAAYGGAGLPAVVRPPAAVVSQAQASVAGSEPPWTFASDTAWSNGWSYNPFSANYVTDLYNTVLLPLAIEKPPSLTVFVPELAASWSVTPTALTVHLRPGIRWQDGTPVTARDVLTGALLEGVDASGPWADVDKVTMPNASTVVFALRKATPEAAAEEVILSITPVPTAVYGRFVNPQLESQLVHYFGLLASNPETAGSSPAGKAITSLLPRVEAFAPSHILGDGPYRVDAMNNAEATFSKWRGFWAAKKIHVRKVAILNIPSANGVFPLELDGRSDFGTTGTPWPVIQHILRTSGEHYRTSPDFTQFALYFNTRRYPFNRVGVRRAIAYAFNRPVIDRLQEGGKSPEQVVEKPDGLVTSIQQRWLTRSQMNSLNSYSYNPKKATAILKSLGFRRTSSGWLLPNGKPFIVSIGSPAGWPGEVTFAKALAAALSRFGIKATANSVEQPGYWTYQTDGQFDLDWGFGGEGFNPLAEIATVLGAYDFASSSEPGLGFGPSVTVPGLGKVDVHATIERQQSVVGPGPQMAKLTWDWARLVNKELPYISYDDKNTQIVYSTDHYVDWAPHSSWMWKLIGYDDTAGLVAMLENGYIRPKNA